MKLERIHWIDIARGIGIIFVIYAHVLGETYRYLFYSFHIPFFFFLSGIFFKKDLAFTTFFKKSVKTLLLPYLVFALIMYALWVSQLTIDHRLHVGESIKQFFSIFYGNSNDNLLAFNLVLWFLPTLFATRIVFAGMVKIFKKTKFLVWSLLFFSLFGYLFSVFAPQIKLPFGLEIAFSAVVFYGAGFLWYKSEKAKQYISRYKYVLFPTLLIVGGLFSTIDFRLSGQVDMRINHLNNYFLFYLNAFLGIFAWIACSMMLKKNALLEKIGSNSLVLFAWHPIVFTYLRMLWENFLSSEMIQILWLVTPTIFAIIAISVIFGAQFVFQKAWYSFKYDNPLLSVRRSRKTF